MDLLLWNMEGFKRQKGFILISFLFSSSGWIVNTVFDLSDRILAHTNSNITFIQSTFKYIERKDSFSVETGARIVFEKCKFV